MNHLRKVKIEFCIKANSSKEKAKTELFQIDYFPEPRTKNLGNSPSYLTITHTTLFAKRFRHYGISMFNFAAAFCFWIE
jgi:hypothetical protein